jgi:hypothetical protein
MTLTLRRGTPCTARRVGREPRRGATGPAPRTHDASGQV